jgi:hypothetical protein
MILQDGALREITAARSRTPMQVGAFSPSNPYFGKALDNHSLDRQNQHIGKKDAGSSSGRRLVDFAGCGSIYCRALVTSVETS